MKFFSNVKSIEELKKEYRKLAFVHHPDRGGNAETMKELNAAYDLMLKKLASTAKEEHNEMEFAEQFKEVIDRLINCIGLEIEVCGSWLWVGGNTKQYKEVLKELGFKWRSKKEKWSLGETTGKKKGEWSMDAIREKFGSEKINTSSRYALV
jgi:hypothetical protein